MNPHEAWLYKADRDFHQIQNEVIGLQGLDTRFRYPDVILNPDEDTTKQSLEFSETILNFVVDKCL